jgi:hypothetical protein
MQFCGYEVTNAAGLRGVLMDLAARAPVVEAGREQWEPVLLPLDALALARSDWHGAIHDALLSVGGAAGKDPQSAVVDFFEFAQSAPAFAVTAMELVATAGDLVSENWNWTSKGDLHLAPLSERLQQQAENCQRRPYSMVYTPSGAKMRMVTLGSDADLLVFARETSSPAAEPTRFAGTYQWAWLRRLAFFSPWAAPLAVDLVAASLQGDDPDMRAAATEYAMTAGDARLHLPVLRRLTAASPAWFDEPVALPLQRWRHPTLRSMVAAALALGEHELATAPGA